MRLEECDSCTGTGVQAGTSPRTCGTCGGQGQVVATVRTRRKLPAGDGVPGVRRVRAGVHAVRVVRRRRSRATQQAHLASRPRGRGQRQPPARARRGQRGAWGGPAGDLYVFVAVKEDPDLAIRVRQRVLHGDHPTRAPSSAPRRRCARWTARWILRFPRGCSPARRCSWRSGGAQARATQRERRPVRDGEGDHPKQVSGEEKELVEKLEAITSN